MTGQPKVAPIPFQVVGRIGPGLLTLEHYSAEGQFGAVRLARSGIFGCLALFVGWVERDFYGQEAWRRGAGKISRAI